MRMEKIRKLILCPGEFWREEDVRSLKDVLLSFPLLLFSYIVTFGVPVLAGYIISSSFITSEERRTC